jgi:hypothetical protein
MLMKLQKNIMTAAISSCGDRVRERSVRAPAQSICCSLDSPHSAPAHVYFLALIILSSVSISHPSGRSATPTGLHTAAWPQEASAADAVEKKQTLQLHRV